MVCFHCCVCRAGGYFRFLFLMPNSPQKILAYMLLYKGHLLLSLVKHLPPSTLFLVGTPCKLDNRNWYSESSDSKCRNRYHLQTCQKHMSCFSSPPFYHSKVSEYRKSKTRIIKKKKAIKNSHYFLLRFFNISCMSVEGLYLPQ